MEKELIFYKRPRYVLMNLLEDEGADNYMLKIAYQISTTYAHTVKIIKNFEELKLVETKIVGRKRIITLTEKGKNIAIKFKAINNLL